MSLIIKKKTIKNEDGSISLEFLGLLPFLFLFMLLLWQVAASGLAILSAQSAVDEAAQVYAVSESEIQAVDKAQDIVGTGGLMQYNSLAITTPDPQGDFEATLNVTLNLVFLPDNWTNLSIPFSISSNGRVME